ncbi:hypothetical protein ACFOKF_16425 [Sphingobium rhizovicinum]|uniref:Uncharacterized protein n=1 Tax=Sphingobium rhizovicinum TaxID=432308 RepID=A0ABV7NIY1_9SPHN
MTTRRQVLAAAIAAPIVATPAVGAPPMFACGPINDPAADYWEIEARFNGSAVSEDQFNFAMERLDRWQPADAEGFLRKFAAMVGSNPAWDGFPAEGRMLALAADANRLVGRA